MKQIKNYDDSSVLFCRLDSDHEFASDYIDSLEFLELDNQLYYINEDDEWHLIPCQFRITRYRGKDLKVFNEDFDQDRNPFVIIEAEYIGYADQDDNLAYNEGYKQELIDKLNNTLDNKYKRAS